MFKLSKKKLLHYIVLPAVLISSDLFIGFVGHFSGATENQFTMDSFGDYLTHLQINDLFPTLFIAIVVIVLVEIIIRQAR